MSLKKMLPVLALTLASCAATTPHSLVRLPDLPHSLTENPPEFRLLTLPAPTLLMPASVGSGES
ncbi:hypothetical protein BGZ92_008618, partial [Podila epicladia]